MSKKRRSSYYDNYWPSYEPTRPISVEDGIKAQSQRGAFVKTWWADRWIKALTRLMDSARLGRGRSYARRGQVLEIKIKPGAVTARVQGSRRTPYKVSIELQPLGQIQWARVFDALAEQALFAAQLLNGEMPPDIERVFEAVHVPLFPASKDDLVTDCSCPDWANPCKHVAAVYYLLGEQFDQDPFLLFALRGKIKEEFIDELRARRAGGLAVAEETAPYVPNRVEAVDAPPLDETLDRHWSLGAQIDRIALHIAPPAVEMPLLKRLGAPDFIDARMVWAQMARVYEGVAARAIEMAFTEVEREPGAE
ncbi:MAG: SWIM zinc finger family protein [Anaerolineae bacterium]|nr:SWIM zinc finger family protein [Anaerolineae bacterium]